MLSSSSSNKIKEGPRTVLVENIPARVSESELKRIFGKVGAIDVRIWAAVCRISRLANYFMNHKPLQLIMFVFGRDAHVSLEVPENHRAPHCGTGSIV